HPCPAPPAAAAVAGPLDNILGTLTIDGGAGSNALTVSDAGDTDTDTVILTATAVTGMAPVAINYQATGGTFGGGITLRGTQAGNTYNVLSTLAGGTATVIAQGSHDARNVSADRPDHNGS